MGLWIVLFVGVFVGLIAAGIGAVVLALAAALLTRKVKQGRGLALLTAFAFPFVCLIWFVLVFFAQAAINESVFHRDPGLGDSWSTPLPNGYVVEFIDVLDRGRLFDPAIEARDGGTASGQEGTVVDVHTAQIAGPLILGCTDDRNSDDKPVGKHCFVLDTRSHRRTDYTQEQALAEAAAKLGVTLKLRPLYDLYAENRTGWFDYAVAAITLLVPLWGFYLIARWIVRLRRDCGAATENPPSKATP